jgi:hypothetical protein
MLKRKNEATMLLKTKDRAWVRFQNEPILGPNEPKSGSAGVRTWEHCRNVSAAIAYGDALN